MIIQAELKCKQTGCEADTCAVDKVIELPSPRFRQFSRALLADHDFIAENKNAIRHDDTARHCLLILDADGTDGFLVDPQGYNYARYSAFVPNARSLLTPDMGIDRSYNYQDYICEIYQDCYIFRTSRPNSMSQTAGSEYEEIVITNYDPRKACWQLSMDSLLGGDGDTRYELIHEPEHPLKI